MSTTQTSPARDLDTSALRQGIEERDAGRLLSLYAEDAELRVVDRNDQPSRPRVIRGRTEIGSYLADLCDRDMTHRIEYLVAGGDGAAFVQSCQYPGGARVLCIAALEVRDGLITRQHSIQAWDE